MIKLTAILLLTSSFLFSSSVVWDGKDSELSQKEYDKAIKEFVNKTYPKKVKAWEKEKERLEKENTTTIDKLMWQDDIASKTQKLKWQKAKNYCENLSLVGYDDWYLPTVQQLKKLYKNKDRLINFSSSIYWTNSHYNSSRYAAMTSDLGRGGYGSSSSRNSSYYVRCVRGE
ncbi:MAG: DUF1566 domain-containing protein [Campylobacterota bacterium]|nr:DUF1566 domain-containing protein [Campylobacterota bacterium]